MSNHVDCTILSLSGALSPLLISLNPSLKLRMVKNSWAIYFSSCC